MALLSLSFTRSVHVQNCNIYALPCGVFVATNEDSTRFFLKIASNSTENNGEWIEIDREMYEKLWFSTNNITGAELPARQPTFDREVVYRLDYEPYNPNVVTRARAVVFEKEDTHLYMQDGHWFSVQFDSEETSFRDAVAEDCLRRGHLLVFESGRYVINYSDQYSRNPRR